MLQIKTLQYAIKLSIYELYHIYLRFYQTVLVNNKPHHWKKQLKHPLCYNIITGSDADFELFVFLFVLLTFVYY